MEEKMINKTYTFDRLTLTSLKISFVFFTITILKLWGGLMNWVINTNTWWFFLIFILAMIKPTLSRFGLSIVEPKKVVEKKKVKKRNKV